MSRSTALDACCALEKRARALARAADADVRRCDAAQDDERTRLRGARATLAAEDVWQSFYCVVIAGREMRAERTRRSLAREAQRARERAAAADSERRGWARIVRGLQRRAERCADGGPVWEG